MRVEFTIPGTAVPFARSGGNGKLRFTPKKQRSAMVDVRLMAQRAMQGRPPIAGPVEMVVEASYLPPASWSEKKKAAAKWKASRPDGDNIAKLIKDACNKIVWLDDAQVVKWAGSKTYGAREETRVYIIEL